MAEFSRSYNALFKTLKMPSLMAWSEHIHEAYVGIGNDYSSYIEKMRDLDVQRASEEQTIERLLNMCVEGSFSVALKDLEHLNYYEWSEDRQIAYLRLRGTLKRQLGASQAALESYSFALGLIKNSSSKARWRWAEKAIRRDILNLHEEKRREDFDFITQEHNKIVALGAWHSNPAFDSALLNSNKSFTEEVFEDFFKGERATRWRSGMPMELAWFNASLALAYLTGDFRAAREARLQFAREQAVTAVREADAPILALAANELIRAQASKELRRFLPVTAYLVQAQLNVNELVLNLRPEEEEGKAAEQIFDTVLVLIEQLSDYLQTSTKAKLNDWMLDETIRFLSGEQRYLVRPNNRVEDLFIKAFSRIANLTPTQISRLVDALEHHAPPTQPWSFWELIYDHDWSEEDRPTAVKAVEIVQDSDFLQTGHDPSSTLTYTYLRVLYSISTHFQDLRQDIDQWLLLQGAGTYTTRVWWYFLDSHHRGASEYIKEMVSTVVSESEVELKAGGPGKSISLTNHYPVSNLSLAYRHYSNAFSEQTKTDQILRLLKASENEHAYSELKATLFESLAEAIETLADKSEILDVISNRPAIDERMYSVRDSFIVSWRDSDVAKLALLKLKVAVGSDVTQNDLKLITNAALGSSNDAVKSSLEVMSECINKGFYKTSLAALILALLKHDSYTIRAKAVQSAVESGVFLEDPLGPVAFETILRLMGSGHPYVMQAVMAELIKNRPLIPEIIRDQAFAQARLNTASSSASVRMWANRMIDSFEEDRAR